MTWGRRGSRGRGCKLSLIKVRLIHLVVVVFCLCAARSAWAGVQASPLEAVCVCGCDLGLLG